MSDQPKADIDPSELIPYFDLGHQGEVDLTQIAAMLRMTPTERLEHHEGWRLFVKEALANAQRRQKGSCPTDGTTG